ncbi:MAG: exonuclease SbcCD subunit D [Halobacteriales archaeon]
MTAIVHTADVHLREGAPERLEGLEAVLALAEERDARLVTIGGDLFDRPSDVEALRPTLRNELFTDRDVEVVVIPGNHDAEAFRGDTFFGDACTVVLTTPFEPLELADIDVRITAVPYTDADPEALLVALDDREPYDGTEALLIHCTLDVGLGFEASGAEDARRYLPVTPAELGELGFEYVLAGHHHDPREAQLPSGTFVYPGTPASTRASETGRRRAVCLDLEAGPRFERLSTYHRVRRRFEVLPGAEDDLLARVEAWTAAAVDEYADATVAVEGFHELDEAAFNERLRASAGSADVEDNTRAVRHLRRSALFQAFEETLEARSWDDEVAAGVRARVLEAFTNVRGELP